MTGSKSKEIAIELVFALCAFWIFFVHSRWLKHPLFDRGMLRDPNFLVALMFMIVLGVANVALSAVLPTLLQTVYGYSVMDTGILMAPRGLGVLVTMIITSRLMGKVDSRLMISVGYMLAALSLWLMTGWSLDMGKEMIIISGFVQGLGLGFVFVPVNMIAFSTLEARVRTEGTTLMTLFRNLGSSFGISIIVTLIAHNIQTSHSDIAGTVTSFNIPAVDPASTAALLGSVGSGALYMLEGEVNRQAAMIAYLDNFYLLFWIMLCFVPLSWLLKKPRSPSVLPAIEAA